MFNRKKIKELGDKIETLENKLFEVQYPNGRFEQSSMWMGHIYRSFKYCYKGKEYVVPGMTELDYTKTKDGFIFVNDERTMAWMLPFGETTSIKIPYPCFHE